MTEIVDNLVKLMTATAALITALALWRTSGNKRKKRK